MESRAEERERSTTAPWPPEREKAVRICWPRPWDALEKVSVYGARYLRCSDDVPCHDADFVVESKAR